MERRTWGPWFRLAGIICALCLGLTRAHANSDEDNLSSSPKVSVAPLWEAVNPNSKAWTKYGAELIDYYGDDLLVGAKDIGSFCPRYNTLKHDDKITAWLFIVSTIVKYESNFSPTDRYEEPGMGKDPVTQQPVFSEGLLQLSYQDVLRYPFCDEFDWHHDKKLSPNDPHKTILDPYKNLKCGIQILNYQIHKYDAIAIDNDAYWSVIMPTSKHNKLDKIKALVSGISICK